MDLWPTVSFGEHLYSLRTELRLSPEVFASRAQLDEGTLVELESNRREPDLDELLAIGQGLGMQVSTILRMWEALPCESGPGVSF